MVKGKTYCGLIFVLALGICASALASDKIVPAQHKIRGMKSPHFLQKEAEIPLPPYLWPSERTQKPSKIVNGTGAISGHVTQAPGGDPIQDVVVMADQLACPSYSYYGFSGIDGFYIIEDLPPGHYEVQTYNYTGFVDVHWDDKLPWEDADSVSVASNDTTKGIDFSLRVGGEISGTLYLTGSLFQSATIFAAYETASRCVYTCWVGDSTEAPVPYFIKGLPTGTYKVNTFNGLGFIDEYYNNDSSWADAYPVSVTEGSTTSPIDFTLDSGGVIQGNVSVSPKGVPWCVIGFHASNLHSEWQSFWLDHGGGSYELRGLRSGYWKVLAYGDGTYASQWWNNKYSWADATTILVTAPGTISGIDLVLEEGGSISGEVHEQGSSPLADCEVIAYKTSSLYQQRGSLPLAFWSKSDSSSADGSYMIGGLPTGAYYVVVTNGCQEMWYNNKPDLEHADTVFVTMPDEMSNIDFYLPTAVETEDEITRRPTEFELYQNYPNPFNPGTEIEYTLHKPAQVSLQIYNLLGQKVKTLVNEYQPFGSHHIVWDGKNEQGKKVSSGVYFYRLEVNEISETKRMVLLK